jgi:hypothetical protein
MLTAHRVGPVITFIAAVLGAAVMFGLGVLAGLGVAALVGLDGPARTAAMLGLGATFGLVSVVASARRHLRRR